MKKRSLNAPKRNSRRPTLAREDAQIKASDYRLHKGIPFRPVPCGRKGEKQRYRLELEDVSDSIVGIDALDDRLRTAGLNLHASAVESMFNTLLDILPAYIAETGHSVLLGNLVTLKPYVTGTIAHMNDAPDPDQNHVELRATVAPALRHALARARLVNTKRLPDGILHAAGGPDCTDGEIDEEHETFVTGRNIYIPVQSFDDAEAKGCAWLETQEGKCIGRFGATEANGGLLRLRLHLDAPRVADCRLVVETYGTPAAAKADDSPVFKYKRNVRLLA